MEGKTAVFFTRQILPKKSAEKFCFMAVMTVHQKIIIINSHILHITLLTTEKRRGKL